jgi:nucleoside-diphosphate-sugar epimerase
MKTVLITGATGLIGGAILRHFHAAGWKTIIGSSRTDISPVAKNVETIEYQLNPQWEMEPLTEVIDRSDVIIHAAAVIPAAISKLGEAAKAKELSNLYSFNAEGTYRLMELVSSLGVGTFVNMSGINMFGPDEGVYGEELTPQAVNPYGLSKQISEIHAEYFNRISDSNFFNFRVVAPYGYGYQIKAVLALFVERAMSDNNLELMGTGAREQVFTYVDDVAYACQLAIEGGKPGTYNITGPGAITMKTLADTIIELLPNSKAKVVYNNQPDPNEGQTRSVPLAKAYKGLGFTPKFDIASGLQSMIQEMQNPPAALYKFTNN